MAWRDASGETMSAIIYNFDRSSAESNSTDESERLFSALGRYTIPELLELLYVGEEPDFFELIRALYALSDDNRLILQQFLEAAPHQTVTAAIDPKGRCVLAVEASEQEKPAKGIAHLLA